MTNLLGGLRNDFPYPEKTCPYCNSILVVVNAVHWHKDPYQYKALYFCPSPTCPVYDEGAKQAYARIAYTSDDAYAYFYNVRIPVQRWEQSQVYSVYK